MAGVGRHPHIIRALAACLQPPLALVTELAASSLHDKLHGQQLRPQYGLLMQLAEDTAAALEHCHALRPAVVHRDLSARNVLLGQDGRARLADFGLAAPTPPTTCPSTDKVSQPTGLPAGGWGCAQSLCHGCLPLSHQPAPASCAAGWGTGHRCLHGSRNDGGGPGHRACRYLRVGRPAVVGSAGRGGVLASADGVALRGGRPISP